MTTRKRAVSFADERGEINEERLTRRKHSLMRWLRGSIDFQIDADYPIRVLAMGIVHSHPPLHRAHLGSVPARFMIGTISYIQSAVTDLLRRELGDQDMAIRGGIGVEQNADAATGYHAGGVRQRGAQRAGDWRAAVHRAGRGIGRKARSASSKPGWRRLHRGREQRLPTGL